MSNNSESSDPAQLTQRTGFVFAAVISALLTTHAYDIGRLGLWSLDQITDVPTTKPAAMEAGLLMIGLGFVIASLLSIYRRRFTGDNSEQLVTASVVGLLGTAFTVVDKTWDESAGGFGIPTDATWRNLMYVFVVAAIFVLPASLRLRMGGAGLLSFWKAACLTIIVGLITTGIIQAAHTGIRLLCEDACLLASSSGYGPFNDSKTAFFLFAPMATGSLIAPWMLMALDPVARPERWGSPGKKTAITWCAGYTIAAILLITMALYLFEYRDHYLIENGIRRGWMARAGMEELVAVLHPLLLSLPAIVALIAAFLMGWIKTEVKDYNCVKKRLAASDWRAVLLAVLSGGLGATVCVWLLLGYDTNLSIATAVMFVVAHAITSACLIVSVQFGLLTD